MVNFTPQEAVDYAANGQLEGWIHDFLTTVGVNKPLSLGLKRQRRWWVGPRHFALALLERCCGPEAAMEYPEPAEEFERRVKAIQKSIAQGWQPPPLIVQYQAQGKLSVRDGSHRLEALLRSGQQDYWVIFWFDSEKDQRNFVKKFS